MTKLKQAILIVSQELKHNGKSVHTKQYKHQKYAIEVVLLCVFILENQPYSGWGRGKNAPLTSFFPVTSTNLGLSPPNFLTFSFNP